MNEYEPSLVQLTLKTILVHTVTYFGMGVLFMWLLDYEARFAEPPAKYFLRELDHPLIYAGPMLQSIRGVIFALAFYQLRGVLFGSKNGWLKAWWLLVAIGILSTFGPSPGSVEGIIYTVVPLKSHITSLPEVVLQSLLLAVILFYWVNHPEKRWLAGILWTVFVLVILMSTMGLLVGLGVLEVAGAGIE
ncbi:hypothetical protein GWO43_11120 [candidate division KSB1 bacterium]|nr:hypothetical protein [candidate division KSB1 bacterium]NIV69627.1 hypothetical protein [Phycisphaerae bacterium]NIR70368.1 hypothetical protein [candidate division KSB1 bacterium]NIS24491.1 hypothetical protein [candidate division KSB1 bacterium]NIT71419.1 hypothetical protein [candidate division KSB1 bacterium]